MIGKVKAFAAGFLLGVFIAPRSGSASRRLLMERINEFFQMGSQQLEALEDELAGRRSARRTGEKWSEEAEVASEPFPEEESTTE